MKAVPSSATRVLAALAFSSASRIAADATPIPAAAARPAMAPAGPKPANALAAISWKLSTMDSAEPSKLAADSFAVELASFRNSERPSSASFVPFR